MSTTNWRCFTQVWTAFFYIQCTLSEDGEFKQECSSYASSLTKLLKDKHFSFYLSGIYFWETQISVYWANQPWSCIQVHSHISQMCWMCWKLLQTWKLQQVVSGYRFQNGNMKVLTLNILSMYGLCLQIAVLVIILEYQEVVLNHRVIITSVKNKLKIEL